MPPYPKGWVGPGLLGCSGGQRGPQLCGQKPGAQAAVRESGHRRQARRPACLEGCGRVAGDADVEGGAARGLRRGPSERPPVPCSNSELDVLRQGADVAAGTDVVVQDSGDGGVIERLGDPLELHGRRLPSLLLRLLPQAPASLRSEPLCGPGGFRGAAAATRALLTGPGARPPPR